MESDIFPSKYHTFFDLEDVSLNVNAFIFIYTLSLNIVPLQIPPSFTSVNE